MIKTNFDKTLEEWLVEFNNKNFKYYDTYNNGFKSINDDPLSDEIKQFLTTFAHKIREAVEMDNK